MNGKPNVSNCFFAACHLVLYRRIRLSLLLLVPVGMAVVSKPMRKTRLENLSHHMQSLSELLHASETNVTGADVARVNLLCGAGLPGQEFLPSKGMDLNEQMRVLDDWASHISSETMKHWYRFNQNPKEFNYSESFFRMLIMSVVLAEEFHVKYDPTLQTNGVNAIAGDGFFASAERVFLSGGSVRGAKGHAVRFPCYTSAWVADLVRSLPRL